MVAGRRRLVGALVAIAAAWVAFEAIWVATGRPAPTVDYPARLRALCLAQQPDGVDGWPILIEATEHLSPSKIAVSERFGEAGLAVGRRPDLTRLFEGDDRGWELAYLDELRRRGTFDLMAEAAAAPRFIRPIETDDDLFQSAWPLLSKTHELAWIRTATMRLAFEQGDADEAIAALEQAMAVFRALGHQPLLLDRMFTFYTMDGPLSELEHAMLEHPPDEATARALLEVLDRQLRIAPAEIVYEAQRMGALATVQRHFTDDGHGDGRIQMQQGGLGSLVYGSGQVGRRETIRLVNEYCDGMLANARQTPAARLATPAFDAAAFEARLTIRHQHVAPFFTLATGVLAEDVEHRTRLEAARVTVALAAWRAARGSYPETLADLAPDILPALPVDPASRGAFGYRRLPEDAPLPYVLYSIGVDGVDDTAGVPDGLVHDAARFAGSVHTRGGDRLFDPRRQGAAR